jgi:ribonucleoside-diphosphate reductase alpha chain
MMAKGEFLQNSHTFMNAGKELKHLAACFVLHIGYSIEEIFTSLKNTALIHKSGGGTGFDFSQLRPYNSPVASTSGVSSGPISFMKVFDGATEAIKQGGTRRGANMGILRVDHPDIMDFIECKKGQKGLNNFNISVALTEEFMEKVKSNKEYSLYNPHTRKEQGQLNAKEVFSKIVEYAWTNGDPGIVFIDRMNKDNPTPEIGKIASTNPCGEQPLLPYESCNLGSINLSNMLKKKKKSSKTLENKIKGIGEKEIDWKKLKRTTHNSVHFLDNVIDMNNYPIEQIGEMTRANRKIGLGVMGFADMLIELGIQYGSDEGLKVADEVMSFIDEKSKEASIKLAEKRGVFDNWKGSIYDPKSKHFKGKELKLRNATTTTIAPTGTISIISNTSSGVEPLFAISYVRNVMDNDELVEVNPLFERVAKENGFYSVKLMKEIAEDGGMNHSDKVPEEIVKVFPTAHDISPEWHVKMQAAIQKYTDNAVSKTVNFEKEATIEEVEKAYMLAHDLGCKGTTIYRDGSRDGQVLSTGKTEKENLEEMIIPPLIKIPSMMPSLKIKQRTSEGNLHLEVVVDPSKNYLPVEIFAQLGNAGSKENATMEALGRATSLHLRRNLPLAEHIKQYKGIGSKEGVITRDGEVTSLPMGFARGLRKFELMEEHYGIKNILLGKVDYQKMDEEISDMIKKGKFPKNGEEDDTQESNEIESNNSPNKRCPQCENDSLIPSEGCETCNCCGFSKC